MDVGGNLRDWRWRRLGWTQAQAAEWAGVTVRTWRRWEHGESRPPPVVAWALRAAAGDLGALSDAWRGWSLDPVTDGLLEPDAPPGHGWRPGDVAAIYWRRQQVAALRRQVEQERASRRHAEARAALLDAANVPACWVSGG